MYDGKTICKKCLIRDLDQALEYQTMFQYIKNLDDDIKVNSVTYETRLLICKECEKLNQGTCIACGCYVEMRAAMSVKECPYKKW